MSNLIYSKLGKDQEAAGIMDTLIIDAVLDFHQSITGEPNGNN